MARARQTITTKRRRRKYGGNTGMEQCHICGGKGVVPKSWSKKKK